MVDQQDRAGDRLLAQRTFFAGPFPEAPLDLYARGEMGVVVRERNRLFVHAYAHASTDTYFGRFPASYWQRWTEAADVQLTAAVEGSGRISMMASDSAGDPRTVATTTVTGAAAGHEVRLSAKIDRFVDGGALWLEVATTAEPLAMHDVRWSVARLGEPRPTTVVICTFNRADDCVHTLTTLAADAAALSIVDTVYVVDQGTDTVESRAGFAAVRDALGAKLRYLRQPNLGGAGGFTRGLHEATTSGAGSHILLMDDDIMLEPELVVRATAFANRAIEPTIVGGQMLYSLHPNQLHTGAETTDLDILRAGLPVEKALSGADLTEKNQDVRVDAGYNAWWACLIPADVVTAIGYPLPLFFQWDDIEYGLRARAQGFPTVTLPGAGVWHADFHWKDWDDWPRYFSIRNALIVHALHGGADLKKPARHLLDELGHYLASMRYGLAATLIMAVEDFLAGPDVLRDGGVEAAAAVRKLRAEYPETARHAASSVPGVAPTARSSVAAGPTPSRPLLVLGKRLVWQVLRKPRATAAVRARDAYWWHVSLFETAVVTEPSQEGVRVRRLDRGQLMSLGKRGAGVLARLVREGPKVRRRYLDAVPQLTSRENWERLFDAR
ncbi:MAG: glycosyltransferase [Actinomycetota bacterium]|nr:glycosyltransferase [Actinomycetota bacterium]